MLEQTIRTGGQIPVTILTGFLGAGKTTLLNRILSEQHGRRIAVIENEFGPEGVDNEILIQDTNEQIVEMNNGCLCCTVRGDLVRILGVLESRRQLKEITFDHVVIETTGLADPGPVLQTFFLEAEVARHYKVDGVISVVDTVYGSQTLDTYPEAQAQVGFADRLLLSKTDLATPDVIDELTRRIGGINPQAPIRKASFGQTPILDLLSIGGFDREVALPTQPSDEPILQADEHVHIGDHSHAPEHDHGGKHHHHNDANHGRHDNTVTAFSFSTTRAFDPRLLEQLLAALAEGYGPDLLRHKGILSFEGLDHRVIVQGVQWLLRSHAGRPWERNAPRVSRMVFIGRDIDRTVIADSLSRCLVPPTGPADTAAERVSQ